MGDKHRSEIQKPVKNTLLSGASHGFPFESFQGSSLLIPVSQDSPSVLNDSAVDSNKSGPKEFANSQNVPELTEAVRMTSLEGQTAPKESKTPPPTASHGYAGIFSSFFSGGSQKKQESEGVQSQRKNSDQSLPYPTHSSSPFPAIPPVQSFSPVLQVPTTMTEQPQIAASSTGVQQHSTGVSVNTPFPQSQGPPQPSFEPHSAFSKSASGPTVVSNVTVTSHEHVHSEGNPVQNFFSKDKANLGQPPTSDIGFESFYSSVPEATAPSAVITKAQSAMDLFGGDSSAHPPSNPLHFPTHVQPFVSTPKFYQAGAGSSDSLTTFPAPTIPSSFSAPLPGPPMSGAATRNYRRDHHKRLAYAQVPGLTSNTSISSSYLQPREVASSISSSALTSPQEAIKQPLSSSFSQPTMSIPDIGSNSSVLITTSTPSSGSLQDFFSSHSVVTPTITSQTVASFDTTTPSLETNSSQVLKTESFVSAVSSSNDVIQPSSEPLPSTIWSSGNVTHAVHPPIMSTREQTQPLVPPVASERSPSPVIIPPSLNNLANMGTSGIIYRPVYHHWFIRTDIKDSKEIWQPFSMSDSLALEQAFSSDTLTPETVVPTDGGRYDVNVVNRLRTAVYWEEEPKTVRRCSWFFKSTTESRLHPYDENTAYNLEEEYKKAVKTNTWSRKVDLLSGDYVLMYGPSSMALFQSTPQTPEGWEAEPDYSQTEQRRPKIVKRGVLDDFDIEEGESPVVDHLIFVVHGIGSVCDFRFRTIEEAGDDSDEFLLENTKIGKVDGFRAKSLQLVKSHFRTSVEEGTVNRVEILPVSWHSHLHGENTGVDKKLQTITLKSIPRLRNFTNDTLLDILFYTSPVYCQNIVEQVGREVNTLYAKFKARNPNFVGGVSLVGHSLGSLILFDMLCHQKPPSPRRMNNIEEEKKTTVVQHDVTTVTSPGKKKRNLSRNVSYVIGNAGTGQPFIEYPQLRFQPVAFFALGSPIGMFVTVRGIDSLGLEFCLPTCSRFFNIFHPFDPVAYRIEALINPDLADKRPVLIPHHKGRKRMHLGMNYLPWRALSLLRRQVPAFEQNPINQLKETMARVGADLKQRLVDSVRSTWNTVYQLTMFGRADDGLEQEVDQVIEKQLERQRRESVASGINENEEVDFNAGRLNLGRRIDYVLQEAPLESFNEYVSAITSHVIYWDSEDTMLLILKEIYGSIGISTDNQSASIPSTQEPPSPSMPSTSYGFR